MKVCWFSTGVSSFIACYLTLNIDKIIYTHVSNQHPDSLRFLHDCENLLGKKIEILTSDKYASVDDVIEKRRCINTPYGAHVVVLDIPVHKKIRCQGCNHDNGRNENILTTYYPLRR